MLKILSINYLFYERVNFENDPNWMELNLDVIQMTDFDVLTFLHNTEITSKLN